MSIHHESIDRFLEGQTSVGDDEKIDTTVSGDVTAHQLRVMWITWFGLYAGFALISFLVWLAILLSKKARSSPFNCYLFFVMMPDWSTSMLYGITSALNASVTRYYSDRMCRFQSFYTTWNATSNCWLMAVIFYELHYMLSCSSRCIRYQPSTRIQVCRNAAAVYVWATLWASWASFGGRVYPSADPSLQYHLICLPIDFTLQSMLFLWMFFIPCTTAIPCIFQIWVLVDVWRKKLLPKKGQRRVLSIYYLRIAVVYTVMWIPPYLLYAMAPHDSTWLAWVASTWGEAYVLVTAIVVLLKPDIALAFRELVTCQSYRNWQEDKAAQGQKERDKNSKNKNQQVVPQKQKCRTTPKKRLPNEWRGSGKAVCNSSRLTLSSSITSSTALALPVADGEPEQSENAPNEDGGDNIEPISDEEDEEVDSLENVEDLCVRNSGFTQEANSYEDVPKQSMLHYQFDDELDERDPNSVICYHIEEEEDETDLPVAPF